MSAEIRTEPGQSDPSGPGGGQSPGPAAGAKDRPAFLLEATMLTAEQQAIRLTGIGSSEIAAIAGLDPYATPMSVWLKKRGLVEDPPMTPAMEWGHRLERVIAERYIAENSNPRFAQGKTERHQIHPWALATPDFVVGEGAAAYLLEIKTANIRQAHRWGEPGTDEIPESYLVQVAWQMAVTGLDRCDVAALIAGNDYRTYTIHRDRELESGLVEMGRRFWEENVQADVPPPPDASEATRRWLASRYPRHIDAVRRATDAEAELARSYCATRAEREALEEREGTLKAQICAAIGQAEGIAGPFGRITWKSTKPRQSVDWEAIAREGIPEETLAKLAAKHSSETAGGRRFLPMWAKEES